MLVGIVRENEIASITLTIVLAHITFIMAELISETGVIFVSSIISTTVASLLMEIMDDQKFIPKLKNSSVSFGSN